MNKVLELYGTATRLRQNPDWKATIEQQQCPFLGRKCEKTRKSAPGVSIGTCSVEYGQDLKSLIICPWRLLERNQVFFDCIHLLTRHEPGNELHIVPEIGVPGGSVDYFLASASGNQVRDFVGIEFQTIDTTGTIWPERQRLLNEWGIAVDANDVASDKNFGMNWKMTAKTILMQLHHKVETFENVNKHLVLALQDHLLNYMCRAFQFEHLGNAQLGDSMHIHAYKFSSTATGDFRISLESRYSTDAQGIAKSLGLSANPNVGLQEILTTLERKISDETLLKF